MELVTAKFFHLITYNWYFKFEKVRHALSEKYSHKTTFMEHHSHCCLIRQVLKNGPYLASFYFIFGLFKHRQTDVKTIREEIRTHDFKNESPPVTSKARLVYIGVFAR